MQLPLGLRGVATTVVSADQLATAPLSGGATGVTVFGTPMMIALMEHAAWCAVKAYLAPGEVTVGTMVQIEHLAPTPVGQQIRAEAELIRRDGRQLLFTVVAYDERQQIGAGQHGRAIVDLARFLARAEPTPPAA